MILETLRELADALSDPTTGVAAQLLVLPIDAGDARPSAPTVADETRHFNVAVGRAPATLPALTLAFDEVVDMDPRTAQSTKDAAVALFIRYVTREKDAETAVQDALYTMRAAERVLDRLPLPLLRNGIAVFSCIERRYVPAMQPLEDQWVVSGIRVVMQVRDETP